MLRGSALTLLLASLAWGDVVVLKDGARIGGKVVDKTTHYEVTVDGVLRTYLKEEVDKVLNSPKELLGDSDKLYEEAKAAYGRALEAPAAEKNAILKEAIAGIGRAREAYAAALDLFPDDDALGKKLMQIMQLTRLLRDRVGSEIARPAAPAPYAGPAAPAPSPAEVDSSLQTLLDPAKRADPARRAAALAAYKARRASSDFASAAVLFLSRTDAEMKLEGPALKAAQDYLTGPSLKDAERLSPAASLAALQSLAALKAAPATSPAADALLPFGFLHAGLAGPAPELLKPAQALGMLVADGIPGTAEGHAIRDLNGWIAAGDFDLAVLAFVKEHRSTDTPAVRYVWSYALLRLVQMKKRGFERPAGAYETVKGAGPVQEHVAALVKSIRTAGVCTPCAGEGKLRCTNCHGKKEIRFVCGRCKGKGGSVNKFGVEIQCVPCKATGIERLLKCDKCKEGWLDCRQCEKEKPAPALEDIAGETACPDCAGRGLAFSRAALPCRNCLGLGRRLVPKADSSKILGQ